MSETLDFEAFRKKYFRFWNVEDSPADNTFDKYQKTYFKEKQFDVDVTDGQLNLEFQGENWACSVSAVVIFPVEKAEAGKEIPRLHGSEAAVLLRQLFQARPAGPSGEPLQPDRRRPAPGVRPLSARFHAGRLLQRHATRERERVSVLRGEAFAGEYEPVTLATRPAADLGKVTVQAGDLQGTGRNHSGVTRSTSATSPTGSAA